MTESPLCPECETHMKWVAYNKALWKEDPGPDHWECGTCGLKILHEGIPGKRLRVVGPSQIEVIDDD